MSRTEAQVQVNAWMQSRQVYLQSGLPLHAYACFCVARRICAEFKVQRAK